MKLFLFQLVATPLPSSPATKTQLFASPEGMLFHECLRYKSKMYTKKYIYLQMVVTLLNPYFLAVTTKGPVKITTPERPMTFTMEGKII